MIEFVSQPWPWYVAGPMIAAVMFGMLWFGKSFGISSNLRTICAAFGAGKNCDFFDFKWKDQIWNLVFVAGLILGGFISDQWLTPNDAVNISAETMLELSTMGVKANSGIAPANIFSWEALGTIKGLIMIIGGGFLVGFGTRYAGGCTSGHAISGLSNLQLPSLIAVIGFFIGGLLVVNFLLPNLLSL